MSKRTCRIVVAGVAIVGAAIWVVQHRGNGGPERWEDDTPLPEAGAVVEPAVGDEDARSEVRVLVRTSLDALTQLADSLPRVLSYETPFGGVTLRRGPVRLASTDDGRRLRVAGTATFDGTLGYGPFRIRKLDCDLSGTTFLLDVDRDWNWRTTPDVRVGVTAVDVAYFPDAPARLVANLLAPSVARNVDIPPVPLAPVAESAWHAVQQEIAAGSAAVGARLSLEARSIGASRPVVDEDGVHQTLVLRFLSRLDVGEAARNGGSRALRPLPPLEPVVLAAPHSTLRIPIVMPVAELSRFWEPQQIDVPGGTVHVEQVEFAEQDGVLHGRMHFEFVAARRLWPFMAESVRGFVRFQTRIECADASRVAEGASLRITEFEFTERSDSLLVDLCGAGAGDLIREGVEAAVPVLSDAWLLRINEVVRAEHEKYVAQAKQQLSGRMTGVLATFGPIVAAASPVFRGISVRPTKLVVKDGYLLLVVEAQASVELTLP